MEPWWLKYNKVYALRVGNTVAHHRRADEASRHRAEDRPAPGVLSAQVQPGGRGGPGQRHCGAEREGSLLRPVLQRLGERPVHHLPGRQAGAGPDLRGGGDQRSAGHREDLGVPGAVPRSAGAPVAAGRHRPGRPADKGADAAAGEDRGQGDDHRHQPQRRGRGHRAVFDEISQTIGDQSDPDRPGAAGGQRPGVLRRGDLEPGPDRPAGDVR